MCVSALVPSKGIIFCYAGPAGAVMGGRYTGLTLPNQSLWWRYWRSEWQTIHPTLSPISVYYPYFHSLLTAPTNALPPKQRSTNIKEKQFPAGLGRGSKWWSVTALPIRCSTGILMILLVFITLPLITLSLMNPLVQTSSHSPKHYGRDMQVRLMAIPHQFRKWVTPLVLFRFKTQQQPQGPTHNKKQKNIKPSLDW